MKFQDLIGEEIAVIPSYLDTFNAKILDIYNNSFLLEITKVSSVENSKPKSQQKNIGDIMYFDSLLNFKLLNDENKN